MIDDPRCRWSPGRARVPVDAVPECSSPGPRPADARRCVDGTDPAPRLTIVCSNIGRRWILTLLGSLDAGSVIALRSQFDQLTLGEFDRVIVDVSDVTAMDTFGAAALGALGDRAGRVGAELCLRHGGRTVSGAGTSC